jgi:hypothetical protein
MEDTKITFKTAKLAKEKEFPQSRKTKGKFRDDGSIENLGIGGAMVDTCKEWYERPTQSLLAKWLREEHEIDILVQRAFSNGIKKYILTPCFDKPIVKGYQSVEKNNYEEAYEIGLQEALKLI